MKKILFFLIFLLAATPAFAAFNGPSDSNTYEVNSTAAASLEAAEGSTCILEGNIVMHIEKNRYLFKDTSGEITVDIPPHVFGALTITPETKIRITGEIRGKRRPDRIDTHIAVRYMEKL